MQKEQQEMEYVCKFFDLGNLEKFDRITEGVLNHNYKLHTTKGVYFVKEAINKKPDTLALIRDVENYMKEKNIPAVAMLQKETGEFIVGYDEKNFIVYPFVESDRSHTYVIQDYFRIGQMHAKIHEVTKDTIPPHFELDPIKKDNTKKIIEILNTYKDNIRTKELLDGTDELFLKYINLKLEILSSMKESDEIFTHQAHILHGDYHAGNLLIDKHTREIIGVCDWEKAQKGSRGYEIARSALFLFENFLIEHKNLKEYLNGYTSIYPISNQELYEGFVFRLKTIVKSKWIEKMYYDNDDSRANKFIEKDIERIKFFSPIILNEDSESFFKKLLN